MTVFAWLSIFRVQSAIMVFSNVAKDVAGGSEQHDFSLIKIKEIQWGTRGETRQNMCQCALVGSKPDRHRYKNKSMHYVYGK